MTRWAYAVIRTIMYRLARIGRYLKYSVIEFLNVTFKYLSIRSGNYCSLNDEYKGWFAR